MYQRRSELQSLKTLWTADQVERIGKNSEHHRQ